MGFKKLDSITFDKFLAEDNPFAGNGNSTLDLRGIGFITSAALVQLVAACFSLSGLGERPVLLVENEDVRKYLTRCGFFETIKNVAEIQPPPSDLLTQFFGYYKGSSPMLIEVTQIDSGAALPDLLDRIVKVLRSRLRYRKNDAFDIAIAVSEICQNTFDHNSNTSGFMAMQVYAKGKRRFLEIGVADYGDGLAATLSRNPEHPKRLSDTQAIQLASKLGVSEHNDQTRGSGLYHLLGIAYKHGGSVQIRSGQGKIRFRMDKRRGFSFQVPQMPGVQVALTLPTKRT